MRTLFWVGFPEEALVVLLLVAGCAFMLGARMLAVSCLGILALIVVAGPFIEAMVMNLDLILQLVILGVLAVVVLRAVVVLLLGRTTAAHLAALLLHDVILAPFRLVRWFSRRRP